MSMTASATSPLLHTSPHQARSSISSVRPGRPESVVQTMPPLLTQTMTPHGQPSTTSSKARSPSPNYFGFQASSSNLPVSTYAGQHGRPNWSPPSSAVRSTAAFSPTFVPVDQNPDFAAFRRQSEGMGRTFALSAFPSMSQDSSPISPKSDKDKSLKDSAGTPVRSKLDTQVLKSPPMRPGPHIVADVDSFGLGRSPKRHLSSDSTNFPPLVRKQSPATSGPGELLGSGLATSSLPPEDNQAPLFALPPPPLSLPKARAETLPPSNLTDLALVTPQHVINLLDANPEEILLLDLRISTHYAKSRIPGALNLCIPTTLIKRPSFNVVKLAETFKTNEQRTKFENWRNSKYIIVYDASASQMKDAAICLNTIKKFESEGYNGIIHIIKGGFAEFAKRFPNRLDKQSGSSPNGAPGKITMPGSEAPLPVIGGCPLPATKSAANPFFGNIRQNMDLIGGVGQIPVKRPSNMTQETLANIPSWLRRASKESDNGAQVSDKFLHIEKREQRRMQDALSGEVSYGSPSVDRAANVQIAGIEKGSKNRYNNIWPFEHSRVKLEDVPANGCDYVNANHVRSSLSHKRYIATQGPIPATFADFWNVVWQQDVRVIVMLTAEKEGGQVKAHDYWSDQQHGPFRLGLLSSRKATLDPSKIHRHRQRHSSTRKSSVDKPNITRNDSGPEALTTATGSIPANNDEPFIMVRRLTLSHEAFPFEPIREITHLQYSSWPDFGAPAHPAHLLGLVEQCDAVVRSISHAKHTEPEPPYSRPVLVHCSAGCGRTGTFCTVDSVIDMLKRQRNAQQTKTTRMSVDMTDSTMKSPKTPKTPSRFFNGALESSPFFSPLEAMQLSSSPIKASVEDDSNYRSDPVEGDWLSDQNTDLIEKIVEDFRGQRLSMVQSLRQFVLCYETVLEWMVEEERRAVDF